MKCPACLGVAVLIALATFGSRAETPAPATRLGPLSPEAVPPGFDLARESRAFEFPRDHGPHPTFR